MRVEGKDVSHSKTPQNQLNPILSRHSDEKAKSGSRGKPKSGMAISGKKERIRGKKEIF
jgi:hypothetical protein